MTSSYTSFSYIHEKSPERDRDIFVFTSNCMEHHPPHPSRPPLVNYQSSPDLQDVQPSRRRPLPYSSPLTQAEWTDVPLPYRPRDYPQAGNDDRLQRPPDYDLSGQFQHHAHESQAVPVQSSPRQRRRPPSLRNLLSRNKTEREQQFDQSMLYPPMSPYNDGASMHSAPEDLEYYHARPISQMSAPGSLRVPDDDLELSSTGIPRAPTFPPTVRRGTAARRDTAAFADEEEFRLFADATAGLGPEQAFREFYPISTSFRSHPGQQHQMEQSNSTSDDIASPLGETPTTMHALQQLAQMPEASQEPQRRCTPSPNPHPDSWMQPPSPNAENSDDDPMQMFDDDELPGYAESQAQAQAHQRAEAARRAQELQRRWQLSGGRRGI